MHKTKPTYTFPDLQANANVASTANAIWNCDITEFTLTHSKVHFFLAIDIKTNLVVAHAVSKTTLRAKQITKALQKAVDQRHNLTPVLIHTDQGTQFTSKEYHEFIERNEGKLIGSMSSAGFHSNQVIERFNRTFKSHKMGGYTLQEVLEVGLDHKKTTIQYIHSLNNTPNSKTNGLSPNQYDLNTRALDIAHPTPKYSGYSPHIGTDLRTEAIKGSDHLKEIIFQYLDPNTTSEFKGISKEASAKIAILIRYFEEKFSQVLSGQHELKEGQHELKEGQQEILDAVTKKPKKEVTKLPLRDCMTHPLFSAFYLIAADTRVRRKDIAKTQVRLAYTILFYTGMRINEARHLTVEDIEDAITTKALHIILHKVQKAHKYFLTDEAVQLLKDLIPDLHKMQRAGYKYIFGKNKPQADKRLIIMINKELAIACERYGIKQNIKSHSFRIGRITSLLRIAKLHQVGEIIGHSDIRSTLQYQRNFLDQEETENILKKAEASMKTQYHPYSLNITPMHIKSLAPKKTKL
jgi:putative transposase